MSQQSQKIATLNDAFRRSGQGGIVVATPGIRALPQNDQREIINLVQTFNTFSNDNDPYNEHDMGRVEHNGHSAFWKIDYYNPDMIHGSEDPSDPEQTKRVMTIMLTNEY